MSQIEILSNTFVGSDFVQSSTGVVDTGSMNAGTIQWSIQPLPSSPDTVAMILQVANENNDASFVSIAATNFTFSVSQPTTTIKLFSGFGRYLRVKVTTSLVTQAGYTVRGVLCLKPST